MAWLDVPQKPCGPYDDTCPDGPMKILIADTVKNSIRLIGNYVNDLGDFTNVVISPDGSRVALADKRGIRVLHIRDAGLIAGATYKLANLRALAFIDDQTLLAQGDDGSETGNKTRLLLIRFRSSGRATVEPIVTGDLFFPGWVR